MPDAPRQGYAQQHRQGRQNRKGRAKPVTTGGAVEYPAGRRTILLPARRGVGGTERRLIATGHRAPEFQIEPNVWVSHQFKTQV